MRKPKNYKRCPRCQQKADLFATKCENCGLIYSRLKFATNGAAKKAFKRKEKNKVINYNVLPKDVSKAKLLLFCIFTGFVGGHCYYVGKTKQGIFMTVGFLAISAIAALPQNMFTMLVDDYYWGGLFTLISFPGAIAVMIWLVNIVQVVFGNYKVPISIDEELLAEDTYGKSAVESVLKSVKQSNAQLEGTATDGDGAQPKENKIQTIGDRRRARKERLSMVRVTCKTCGRSVKVKKGETICPNCDEKLSGEDN